MELTIFRKWLEDAVRDGWTLIDPNGKSVSGEIITDEGKWEMQANIFPRTCNITIWGPDDLQCIIPKKYERPSTKWLRICPHCGTEDVDTFRYSFAGRACAKCLPALKEEHEYPGWCS